MITKKIYVRQYYMEKIRGFYNSDLIKVISGIRRCGKSCFMLSVIEDLKQRGVADKNSTSIFALADFPKHWSLIRRRIKISS